ncbi:MAG: Tim44/TimA family putative adaptor protein [Pseudomonadota bacterium]
MFYVVLLAMVSAFLALRLYMVLGKRTGHEQQPLPRVVEERAAVPAARAVDAAPETREVPAIGGRASPGLRAIIAADPNFDAVEFVEGAKSAYRMILEAFWKADRETLTWLAEEDVARAFGEAIDGQAAAGHTLDNRLVAIERAAITNAVVESGVAKITVRFDADIAAVTRDAEGAIVSGSMSDAVETHDVWTFARTLKSDDPNWKLAETDEA